MIGAFRRTYTSEVVSGWETLETCLKKGAAKEFLGNNATLKVWVEGIGRVTLDVLDYDKEKMVDPEKKHSVTLAFRDLLFDEMEFSRYGINEWEDSDIRHYINSPEFIERFEPGFRELLSPVYKKNDDRADTADTFFLLSKEELEGGYEFFKTERDRVKVNKKGETERHWTRSAIRGGAYNAWYVDPSGLVGYGGASWASRFSPACVISA